MAASRGRPRPRRQPRPRPAHAAPAPRPSKAAPAAAPTPRPRRAYTVDDVWALGTMVALLVTLGTVLCMFWFGTPTWGGGQMWIVASPYKAVWGLALTVLSAAVFAVWWVERGLRIRWPGAFWPLVVVFGLSVVSTAVSDFRWMSIRRLALLTAVGAVVFIIVQTLRRRRDFVIFVGGILVLGAVVTLFGLYQRVNQALWDLQEPAPPQRPAADRPAGTDAPLGPRGAAEREEAFWKSIEQAAESQRAGNGRGAVAAVDQALRLRPGDPTALAYRAALTRDRFVLFADARKLPFVMASRIFSFMVNPNFLGGVLVVLLPMAIAGALASSRPGVIAALLLLAVGMLVALFLTLSRGSYLGGIAGMIVFYLLSARRLRARFPDFFPVLRFLFCAGLVVILGIGGLVVAMGRAHAFAGGTIETRRIMWRGAGRAVADRPVFGFGIGTFQLIFPTYRPTDYRKERLVSFNTSHAHCEVLELLTDFGVVGLLACVAAVWVFYREVWRHLSWVPPPAAGSGPPGGEESAPVAWLGLGAAAGCAGALVNNLVGVNLRWAAVAWTFWTAAGVALAAVATRQRHEGRLLALNGLGRWAARGLVWAAAALLVYHAFGYAIDRHRARTLEQDADLHLQEAGRYMDAGDAKTSVQILVLALDKLQESYALDPYQLETLYRLGHVHYMLGRLIGTSEGARQANALELRLTEADCQQRSIAYFEHLRGLAPNYARVHKQMGLVYDWAGRAQDAIAALERDLVFNPRYDNTETLLGLGEIYLTIGRTDRATAFFRRITDLAEEQRRIGGRLTTLAARQRALEREGRTLSRAEAGEVARLEKRRAVLAESTRHMSVAAARQLALRRLAPTQSACLVRWLAAALVAVR